MRDVQLPIHGNPTFKFGDGTEKVEKPKRKKPSVKKQSSTGKPHPKQILLNFFEWRTGIEFCHYDDGNFYIVEVKCADEPASLLLMQDLANTSNHPFHCHFSPRNNRLKVYIDKDIEL
nr:hypothetical protein [uncultured Draconibacterium sp.]